MIAEQVKTVPKKWGREVWFANNEEKNYCGKILEINPGQQLSLHFHLLKEEHLFNMSGDCMVEYLTENADSVFLQLDVGYSFHIKPGLVHRFSTKNGCTLLEASTFHRDSDSYRVQK